MYPKHDTPFVLPEARGYTSWSASLTHWTADLWPLISPEPQSDPRAHSPAPAGSLGSQLTQQYCVMLSLESLLTSAARLHSGNQCQTKWMLCLYAGMCLCASALWISPFFCSFAHGSGHIVSLFTSSTAFPFSPLKIHVLNYRWSHKIHVTPQNNSFTF